MQAKENNNYYALVRIDLVLILVACILMALVENSFGQAQPQKANVSQVQKPSKKDFWGVIKPLASLDAMIATCTGLRDATLRSEYLRLLQKFYLSSEKNLMRRYTSKYKEYKRGLASQECNVTEMKASALSLLKKLEGKRVPREDKKSW